MPAVVTRVVRGLVALGAIGLVMAWILAWVPAWPCVLFEHFRVQYAVVGVLVTALAALGGARGLFDVAAIATLLHAMPLVGDLGREAPHREGRPLRVLLLNVQTETTGYDRVRRLIDDTQPDVIGLVEVSRTWLDALAPSLNDYVGRLEEPHADNFGVALYSKHPLEGAIETHVFPTAIGRVAIDGAQPVTFVVVHPMPPVSSEGLALQRDELAQVAARVRQLSGPVVLMGDLNATPWSTLFRELRAATGLCDTRAGFGLQASWPTWSSILRIPLDHVLASCSLGVTTRRIERAVGSDHFPVVVDLVIPGPA